MSCCGDKPKHNCGERIASACVFYSKYFPKYSKLKDKDCVTLEETTEELYKNQEKILESIDTKDLGKHCLDYPTTEIDNEEIILIKDILKTHEDEICKLLSESEEDSSDDFLSIDFKCLTTDPCDTQINDLKSLLQAMINKLCDLEERINNLEA